MKQTLASRENTRYLAFIGAVLAIATLYFGKVVFIPLVWASLFAFVLTPVVAFLEKLKLPRTIAIFFVVMALVALVGLIGWNTSRQLSDLTSQIPGYEKTLSEKIRILKSLQGHGFFQASNTVKDIQKQIIEAAPSTSRYAETKKSNGGAPAPPSQPMPVEVVPPTSFLETIADIVAPLTSAGLVAIFTLFILLGREDIRNRFIRMAGETHLHITTQALDDAGRRINRYLLLQLVVNATYGLVIGTVLHFIGIPNAPLWGISAAILRFLPYLGPPIAASMPILLSLAVFSGWHSTFAIVALFLVLELVVANFVEPLLYGAHIGLSPLALLVTAVFWTSIWGFPGLMLSTPLTVCLVVMGRYVPSLRFLSILLGDEPVLSRHAQYYQRLLATDQNEARLILEQHRKDKSLEEVYGSVVIPALILAQQDRQSNGLPDEAHEFICQSTRELIEELGANLADPSSEFALNPLRPDTGPGSLRVLCIPAAGDAEEVVALLLSQLFERLGHRAKSVPLGSKSQMLSQVLDGNPDVVRISALAPFAVEHARALYEQLRCQVPQLQVITCLWHFEGDAQKAALRLRMEEGDRIFTTLDQVLKYVSDPAQNATLLQRMTASG